MQSVSNDTFGPLIAYLVPGATVLAGVSPFVPAVQSWFAAVPGSAPTIGGFLYLTVAATVAATAAGMTVSAIRWAFLDTVHSRTGLPPPALDFSQLGPNVEALRLLIEIHYRHYQFYATMAVALVVAWAAHRTHVGWDQPAGVLDLAAVLLEPVFLATSRDTLRKYYARTAQLLPARVTSSAAPARAARRTRATTR